MFYLTLTLATVILAAIPVTIWLKREGDRLWAEHQARQRWLRLNLQVRNLTTHMARLGVAAQEAQRGMVTLANLGVPMSNFFRRTAIVTPRQYGRSALLEQFGTDSDHRQGNP